MAGTYTGCVLNRIVRAALVVTLSTLVGCGEAAACGDDSGPETLQVDASALAAEWSNVVVCLVPETPDSPPEELCSQEGSPIISYTSHGEYPAVIRYYVQYQPVPGSYVSPRIGGTHRMECVATTSEIFLTND
jgi:hypothetical protein